MTFSNKKIGATMLGGFLVGFGLLQVESAEGSRLSGTAALAGAGLVQVGLAQTAGAQTESATEGQVQPERPRSPKVILEDGRGALDRMEAAADNMSRQLRQAREDKDVVKMLCLDDKLNQMNVATRSASDRVASIEAAVKVGNAERAQHDDAVLSALIQRGNELIAEANQCIGEETGMLGLTKLDLTIDPSITTTDTAAPPITGIISTPPVAASPTS